ncbi:uncharacterized protein LOC121740335 [Aricia agestis]|uniref:uncharacterized protein LOC121740335 n=1 Tax=Aricia agestis TaxID=91739 RepID=UPI001C2030BA|nr:uncharacterized protein LOC121740335 [Aricia agestis]
MPKRKGKKSSCFAENKRRRIRVLSSDSSEADENADPKTIPGYEQQLEEVHDGLLPASPSPCAPTQTIISSTSDKASDDVPYTPELPPEILSALGDSTDDIPDFGEDIHPNLAQRWTPILRKVLDGDLKAKLMAEYKIPANCTLLKSPTINPEISVAITGALKARDKKLETAQHQLGLGISALNKAMTLLLTSEDKIQAIKILSDSCRILSDLHHIRTDHRVSLLTPSLDKSFLEIVEGRERSYSLQ